MTQPMARALWLASALLVARALAPAEPRGALARAASAPVGAARLLYGLPLDVNREPSAVLELIPGIGPVRASAIVSRRPHCSLADLDRTPGVGPVTLSQLERFVAFPALPPDCKKALHAQPH